MYKKILIACDGSNFSDVALKRGRDLARLCNAELHLVGIFWTAKLTTTIDVLPPANIWEKEEQVLEEALEVGSRKATDMGLAVTTSIRQGDPALEIAACAGEIGADIVVIGHSEKGFIARWFEGSVGAGLLKDLPCDLLVATAN